LLARESEQVAVADSKTAQHERWVQAMRKAPCTDCELHLTRKNMVLYRGNPEAYLSFLSEAPGKNEDEQGIPFVGQAGELLDKMIKYMKLDKDQDVFITNVLMCRPPANRNPLPEEVKACRPYFTAQLNLVNPRVLVVLGKVAAVALGLLSEKQPLKDILGTWTTLDWLPSTEVITVYHPAYLLRNKGERFKQAGYLDLVTQRLKDLWLI
jgi:DNA polymerase